MEKLIWHPAKLPEGIEPNRVHAVLVTSDGRVFLRYKNGEVRKVTGGHIEPGDINIAAALEREVLEEIHCKIDRHDYLGYVEYFNDEENLHEYWVREVARIAEILPAAPDPDREDDWTYGRTLAPMDFARTEKVVPEIFAPAMAEILEAAYRTATENKYFTEPVSNEVEVLNEEIKY